MTDGPRTEQAEYQRGWDEAADAHAESMAQALAVLSEPMRQAYGYLVALVNHGGETEAAALKARDHLREAIRRLEALRRVDE